MRGDIKLPCLGQQARLETAHTLFRLCWCERRATLATAVSPQRTRHEPSPNSTRWRRALLAVLYLSATEAAAGPLGLAWDAPAGCPSQAAVLQGVERIVGRPLDQVAAPWTSARGAVMRQQEGWLLQVIVVGADGTRNERLLVAASCAEAAEAASVVLATSLTAAQPEPSVADAPAPDSNGSPAPAKTPNVEQSTA
ncbi:MAG TPA: hypothetical protein VI197_33380, partial [Polyangiaceae bacterium]